MASKELLLTGSHFDISVNKNGHSDDNSLVLIEAFELPRLLFATRTVLHS